MTARAWTAGVDSSRLLFGSQSANVKLFTCPADTLTTINVRACPTLAPGVSNMMFHVNCAYKPLTSCRQLTFSINEVSSGGVYIGNLAFWNVDRPTVGDRDSFAGEWLYDPRLTPPSPEVPDDDFGSGAGRYLGFCVTPTGGAMEVEVGAIFQIIAGRIPSITLDTSSSGFFDDKGTPIE